MAQGNQPQKRNFAAEAFGRHYAALHSALAQPDVASGLATKFYNGAIITSEIRDVVQMTSFTPEQQADWLLRAVESSIRRDHTKLRRLIKVLRKQPVLKPIAKQLRQCYRELVSEARFTESSGSGSDTDSTEQLQSQGLTTRGKLKLPYKGGGASKGNRPPAVGKGKRRKESSSGPKAKKIRLRAGSEDEFDSSLKDETHRPGFIPPPINRDEAQREQGTQVKDEAFPELLNILYPVASKWESFAQQIGVPFVQLTHIKAANPQADPSICLSHALKWWQSNHDSPVYEIIIDVLDPGIGKVTPAMNKALAKKVREFLAKQKGSMTRGERSPSPYQEGGASKGNRPPAIGEGKRRKQSSSGPKAKKTTLSDDRVRTRSAGSELEFEGSLEAGTHRPCFVPPPMNGNQAKRVKAREQGAREMSVSSQTVSLSTPGSISGSGHEDLAPQGQNNTFSTFPYLDIQELSEQEKLVLRCKLLKDSRMIMHEFSDLIHYTIKSIVSSGVSVGELHTRLSTLEAYTPTHKQVPLLRDQLDDIERAETIDRVFSILQKYYSFFNYGIIEEVISWFGTPEDKERLETYAKKFKEFCKRRTFECPPDISRPAEKGQTNLVLKVEENWGPKIECQAPVTECLLDSVLLLHISLSDILGIMPWTLNLRRIDKGCMELLFQVPSFIEEDIFPLSMEQEKSLSAVGVTRLTCGSYSFPQPQEALMPQTPSQAETQVKPKRTFKEISSDSTSGTRVQKSALPKLLVILSPVVHNWSSFAGLIGVPSSQISVIEAANPRYTVKCLSQSLDWWITNHCNPTYEAILAILDPKWGETTPLMNRDLAKEVKEFMTKEQGPSIVDNSTKQSIVKIHEKFESLLQTAREYLQKKMKKHKIEDLRLFILELFPDISPDLIPNSSDLNEIFEAMRRNRLWSYMNYFSLEQIVNRFCGGNLEMTHEVEKFKMERAKFQLATKIREYIPAAKAYLREHKLQQLNPINPDYFTKLSVIVDGCDEECSLKYLEELWQSLSFHMQLPPITLLFEVISGSGFIQIIFLIPTKLVQQVIHQAQYSAYFYGVHLIRTVTVGDTCIYESKYAEKCSTFMAMKRFIPHEDPMLRQGTSREDPMLEQGTSKEVPTPVQTKDLAGGYECTLVEVPTVVLESECSVCLQILREPHMVTCCGNRMCNSCINHIKVSGEPCPLCRATDFETVHDKKLEEKLKHLQVRCTHAKSGCKWTGELRLLDKHFNVNPKREALLEGCGFTKVKCIHCGSPCQRSLLTSHLTEQCQKRGPSIVDESTSQSIVKIQGKFETLFQTVHNYLQKKMKKHKIVDLRLFILELFPDISPDLIPNSSDLNEIFEAMRRNRLWSYMNYFSLEQIVNRFCGDKPEMTHEVEKFKMERAEFQLETKIREYIPAAKAYLCKHEINPLNPDHFSKLSLTLNECAADYSLKYLEELWQSLSFHMQLPPIQLLFDVIDRGSIQIVFLIPARLMPQVIRQAQYSAYFYRMHHIHRITVGDNCACIYESKYTEKGSAVTTAMEQAVPKDEPRLAQTKDFEGGYNCDVVETPLAELQIKCCVCRKIFREPRFVSCCNNCFCKSCISHVIVGGKGCPICNSPIFDLTHDKQFERSLKDLQVRCTHAESGCKWTGELRKLDEHLNVNPKPEALVEGCDFTKIQCIHCGNHYQRKMLPSHQTEECQKWPTRRGTQVKKESLPMLSHLLSPVACSWELFAQQIGVPVAQLSQIKVANPQTGPNYIYKCFTQVLEWWVANHENPVYETMIDALDPGPGNTSPVMNRALARELREFMAKQRGMRQPTLEELLDNVKPVQWQRMGLKLGVQQYDLDVIEKDRSHDTNGALLDMLRKWFRGCKNPTWGAVVKAMKEIGEVREAKRLQDMF